MKDCKENLVQQAYRKDVTTTCISCFIINEVISVDQVCFTCTKSLRSNRTPRFGFEVFIGRKFFLPPPSITWKKQIDTL